MVAYVNGVSAHKVDRLVGQVGIKGVDTDRVSRLCRALDEHVDEFRNSRQASSILSMRPPLWPQNAQ